LGGLEGGGCGRLREGEGADVYDAHSLRGKRGWRGGGGEEKGCKGGGKKGKGEVLQVEN
jgi:hypothetical protein